MLPSTSASTPPVLKEKNTLIRNLVRIAITVGLIAFLLLVVVPQFASYEGVGEAISAVTTKHYVVLFLLATINEIAKGGTPAVLIHNLSVFRGFVAGEASNAISNVVPGPSGTAMRYIIYRSWDISAIDFGRSTVMNSVVNNLFMLAIPIFAIIPLAIEGHVPAKIWWIVGIAAVLSFIGLAICIAIAKSERFAHWFGFRSATLYAWYRGIRKKPLNTDVAAAVVKFRGETLSLLATKWLPLLLVIFIRYFLTYMVLFASLRFCGVPRDALLPVVIFGCYAVARIITLVEITPGGVGYTEIVYVTILEAAAGGKYGSQITAGVIIFRAFTYVYPIVLGGFCYGLWSFKSSWRVVSKEQIAKEQQEQKEAKQKSSQPLPA